MPGPFIKIHSMIPLSADSNLVPLSLKGTGTRDLIWLKVVSLYRSWLVGLTDDRKNFFKCCFIFFINILKSLVVQAKFMPIADVNRIGFVN